MVRHAYRAGVARGRWRTMRRTETTTETPSFPAASTESDPFAQQQVANEAIAQVLDAMNLIAQFLLHLWSLSSASAA